MKDKRIVSVILAMAMVMCLFENVSIASASDCNHVWSAWTVEEKATCGDDRYEYRECSECGDYETKILPATGNHIWSVYYTDKPTCSETGIQYYSCLVCSAEKTETLPEIGVHNWTEWVADSYLCKDGKWSRECRDCYQENAGIVIKKKQRRDKAMENTCGQNGMCWMLQHV